MSKTPPLIKVIWEDASSKGIWMTLNDAKRALATPCTISSVGFLVGANSKRITITQGIEHEDHDCMGYFVIPRGCIKKISHISLKNGKRTAKKTQGPSK